MQNNPMPVTALKRAGTSGLAAMLVVTAPFVVPHGFQSATLLAERKNPANVANIQLKQISAQDYENAIEEALTDDDAERAESLLSLADSQSKSIPAALRLSVEEEAAKQDGIRYQFSELWDGALTGRPESSVGLAGAIATDLTTIGDVRDIIIEGGAYLNNEDYDALILGLSITGLAATAAVILSGGAGSSVKFGTSTLKAASKAGVISRPLRRSFGKLASGMINGRALREAMPLIKRGNLTGARHVLGSSINPKPLAKMQDAAMEVGAVIHKNGFKAGADMLKVAKTPADLTGLSKLSTHFGKRFRAVLAVLGTGAIWSASLFLTTAGWLTTFMLWLAGATWFAFKFMRLGWRLALLPLGRSLMRLLA